MAIKTWSSCIWAESQLVAWDGKRFCGQEPWVLHVSSTLKEFDKPVLLDRKCANQQGALPHPKSQGLPPPGLRSWNLKISQLERKIESEPSTSMTLGC